MGKINSEFFFPLLIAIQEFYFFFIGLPESNKNRIFIIKIIYEEMFGVGVLVDQKSGALKIGAFRNG